MKNKYNYYLVFGIIILIVPTFIYLYILVPQLKEEYTSLLASGGIIGAGGYSGGYLIPAGTKRASLLKLTTNIFTTLIISMVVQEFINEIFFLVVTFVVSFIIFLILKSVYKEKKEIARDERLAKTIKESISTTIK